MSQNILTEPEYNTEVRHQAWYLQQAVAETDQSPLEVVVDTLNAHKWFQTGNDTLTSRDHGAIIGVFDSFNANIENYGDPDTLTEGDDFPQILRKMAFAQFEADVLTAFEQDRIEKPPQE